MTLVQRFPNAPQNYDAQNEAQFRNMVRQALSDASSPVVLTESVGQSFEASTGGTPAAGDALVYAGGVFTATKTFTGAMTFSAALTATAGGSLTGTWSDMGSVTTIDINGGSIDGTPIGAAVPSTGAFSSVDIDGGTLDGVTIGGTTPGAGTFTTLNATGGGALTGTWSDLGSVTTVDINGGTIDGTVIGGASAVAGSFALLTAGSLNLANQTVTGNTTLDTADCVVFVDASSNDVTITLPTAAAGDGIVYLIKRVDTSAYVVTVDGDSAETIDNNTTVTLLSMDAITITSDGTEWWIV